MRTQSDNCRFCFKLTFVKLLFLFVFSANTVLLLFVGVDSVYAQENSDYPYAIISIESSPGDGGGARGINNYGEITGLLAPYGGFSEPFYWNYIDGMIHLSNFGGNSGNGWEINDIGHVVGQANRYDGKAQAFYWDGVDKINLGTLGGLKSYAFSINNSGYVVGTAEYDPDNGGPKHAFIWKDGVMTDLGVIADCCSAANDINEAGLIVGYSTDEDGWDRRHAAMWQDGQIIDLGTLPYDKKSEAYGLNDIGQIVGYSAFGYMNAIYMDQGTMYNIHDVSGWEESWAYAINNNSQVVGTYGRIDYPDVILAGFIWDPVNGGKLLNDFIPPNSKWTAIDSCWDINDLGQIAVRGLGEGGFFDTHSAIITPVYTSFDLSRVWPGIAGELNGIRATNVIPGTRVFFTYNAVGGGSLIPGCDVTVNALQIDNPNIAGNAVADENGIATLTGIIPAGMQGKQILFQAVIPNTCEISNLIVQKFN